MWQRLVVTLLVATFAQSVSAAGQEAGDEAIAADTVALARDLAAKANIPLGTVLTDLITKAGPLSIESTLASTGASGGDLQSFANADNADTEMIVGGEDFEAKLSHNRNSRTEYLDATVSLDSPAAERAVTKGYTPRTIEFDPRFETNVGRVAIAAAGASARDGRIWQGIPVPSGSDAFPDAVAIVGNNGICSGTLVAPDKVLTAAHCYCDGVTSEVILGQSILSPSERIPVDLSASEVFRPCDEMRDLSEGDVALLKLSRAATIPPRRMTSLNVIRDAASVRAVGFGRTEANNLGFKYQINIVIASFQCDGTAANGRPDREIYRCRPEHELVAAGLNRDTCGGDSGGPIYVFGPDNQVYLAGLTSRATDPDGRCGPGGIYVLPAAPPIKAWLEARGVSIP
jgi:hypothetical protein